MANAQSAASSECDHVAGAADRGRLVRSGTSPPRPRRSAGRAARRPRRRAAAMKCGASSSSFGRALHGADDQRGEVAAGVHCRGGAVRRPRTVRRPGRWRSTGSRRSNSGTGARRMIEPLPAESSSVGRPGRRAAALEPRQRGARRWCRCRSSGRCCSGGPRATSARSARSWSSGSKPPRSSRLSARHSAIEVSSVHSPGLQAERPAADHVGDRLEGARRLELQRRPQRVAGGEAEQRAAVAIDEADGLHSRSVCGGGDAAQTSALMHQTAPPRPRIDYARTEGAPTWACSTDSSAASSAPGW